MIQLFQGQVLYKQTKEDKRGDISHCLHRQSLNSQLV